MIKIEQKIVSQEVVSNKSGPAKAPEPHVLHEKMARPEQLQGTTYKIKTPLSEHALYVTINDIILNNDTPHEVRRPFEVFINSKNMDNFQWVVAMTRIMSAVFRKGGEVAFLVEELKSVFDPNGGFWKKGGKYVPSIVAEIGNVLAQHLEGLGLYQPVSVAPVKDMPEAKDLAPKGAQCDKCQEFSVVMMDGCNVCLSCGASKCS